MSFQSIEPGTVRLNRSELAVPGSQVEMFEKAAKSAVDIVFLDLEDAVAPDEKVQARKNIIEALNDIDWGDKAVSIRINGLDTHYMYRDVVDVVEQAGKRLDLIMIPKVGNAADVYALDMLVTQIEAAKGYPKRIGFEHIIETALGMQNVAEIAAASNSTRARSTIIGGVNRDYAVLTDEAADGTRETHWGDMWHYALARLVVACRANGLRPIDGPFGDFKDPDGYTAAAKRAAVLGCEGKWAIHPSQIELANRVMSPSEAEITQAKRILSAMNEAERDGKGAVSLDGRLIDYASIRQAETLLEKAKMLESVVVE